MIDTQERRSLAEALPKRESRTVKIGEVRDADGGGLNFRGYASTTDHEYPMGWYDETIKRGAFTKTTDEMDDVRLLVNHDGIPLARTKSGTLQVREVLVPEKDPQERGQTGLWAEATLAEDSPLVASVRSAMKRGDLDEMSFGFTVTRQQWSEDFTKREIQEVRLFDVSVVTYPANDTTSASLRSVSDMLTDLDDDEARAMLAHLQARFAPAATPELDRLRALAAVL